MLYLTEADVERLLDMPLVLDVVERAFAAWHAGRADNVPRRRAKAPGVVLHSMSAAAEYLGFVGWKNYTTTRGCAIFHVGLYEAATGRLVALIEANRLGQLRTGAVTGLAVKHLSPSSADELGLIGCGWQAESQLAAVAAVRPLRRVLVHSRDPERRRAFAQRMSQQLWLDVTPVAEAREAVEHLPLVVTITSSRTPVVAGDRIAPGALVCAAGGNWLEKSELDLTTFRRASRVVCDDVAACQVESGELAAAVAAGAWSWQRCEGLAAVIGGAKSSASGGRGSGDDVKDGGLTVFKSVGLALEDLAVAVKLVELAHANRVGQVLPVGDAPKPLGPRPGFTPGS